MSMLAERPWTGALLPRTLMFPDVLSRVKREDGLWHEDREVEPRELRVTPEDQVVVPGLGPMALTPWSRKQLASILGIRWDRWFERVSGQERAEELNRRLSRLSDPWKLRTRLPRQDEPCSQGVLAALVSPTYTPINDLRVLESMERTLGGKFTGSLRFRQVLFTDRSSHLSVIAHRPVTLTVAGREEHYFAGFHIRNSPVGFSALTMVVSFLRLVCSNGLMLAEGAFRLLYRTHRPIAQETLDSLIEQAFHQLPSCWQEGLECLAYSRGLPLYEPESEIKALLKQVPGLSRFREPVLLELAKEGPTRFGLVQALTSVAQGVAQPDTRFELERLAGRLLLSGSPRQGERPVERLLEAPTDQEVA